MKKVTLASFVALFFILGCQKNESAKEISSPEVSSISEVSERQCASDEVLQKQIAEDPQRAAFLNELEKQTRVYKGRAASRLAGTLYLPVVVHIVHTNANIVTDAQIQSQIDVLNKDFNKTNSELANSGVYLAGYNYNNVANCDIQFYLKQTVRKQTTVTSFGSNDAVKKSTQGGSDAVNSTTMLNVWVCDLSSGLLGYAQFPGGSATTDGVVIDYQAFGTSANYPMYAAFNLGRTATHEVGHWINLRHIWGDRRCGDDLVGDTPQHDGSNGGCPSTTHTSKCAGKPREQWMNYMDYTNDGCMYMFSGGQKTRMDAAIDLSRKAYFSTTKI